MNTDVSTLDDAIRVLQARGWFAELSKETQKRLSSIAKLRTFGTGESIYLSGEVPDGIFGLVQGSITIAFPRNDGEDYIAHHAGCGFWVGDLAVFAKAPRLVSIHAAEPTTMVQLRPHDIAKLVRQDPELHTDFYALSYQNVKTALNVLANLAIISIDKRVADRLLLESAAHPNADGWVRISQPDLANLLAISLPTLRRTIGRFASAGLVEQGYGRVKVLDREGLRGVCVT